MKYKRLLIKLSGEVLATPNNFGINYDYVLDICKSIKNLSNKYEIGIVVGGGNFWRGRSNTNMDAVIADNIGMYATIMNAMALKDAFKQIDIDSVVQVPNNPNSICEIFSKEKALNHLNSGKVVIFGGGTGSPFFSTDTASTLRALEIDADLLVKLTNVDGVYDKDPNKFNDAIKYNEIDYQSVIEKGLKVMDLTAIALAKEKSLSILVTNINKINNLDNIIEKNIDCTIVK